jgi:hypothetical protein
VNGSPRDWIAGIVSALIVILQIINALEGMQILGLEKQIKTGIERNYDEGNQKFTELLETVSKLQRSQPLNAPRDQ